MNLPVWLQGVSVCFLDWQLQSLVSWYCTLACLVVECKEVAWFSARLLCCRDAGHTWYSMRCCGAARCNPSGAMAPVTGVGNCSAHDRGYAWLFLAWVHSVLLALSPATSSLIIKAGYHHYNHLKYSPLESWFVLFSFGSWCLHVKLFVLFLVFLFSWVKISVVLQIVHSFCSIFGMILLWFNFILNIAAGLCTFCPSFLFQTNLFKVVWIYQMVLLVILQAAAHPTRHPMAWEVLVRGSVNTAPSSTRGGWRLVICVACLNPSIMALSPFSAKLRDVSVNTPWQPVPRTPGQLSCSFPSLSLQSLMADIIVLL